MKKVIIASKNPVKMKATKIGFEKIYGKGSHFRFKHKDGRRTVVPVHANEELGKGLVKNIL